MALTAEQLRTIQEQLSRNNGFWTDPQSGNVYSNDYGPNGAQGTWQGDQYTPAESVGYRQTAGGRSMSESPYSRFDMQGHDAGSGRWPRDGGGLGRELAIGAGILGTMGLAGGMFGAGAAGSSAGGSGAFLGEGVTSGIPAWDSAMSAAQAGTAAGGAGAGAGAGAGGGGPNFSQGFTDGGTAGGALDSAYTGMNTTAFTGAPGVTAGAGGGAGAGAGATGTAASGIASGLSSVLGPLATVAGGLLGAQGQRNETQRRMDPRLDSAVYGENGLVPRTQGLLAEQMSPEARAGWAQMRQVGQGLLSNPIAGNGVGRVQLRR